ncbi:MAG: SpoIIE family protein phosphatase, partial [Acidobacteriaceae bacterium]|nr:SpoIIE family protein phosphatase [Acidobacteriaceae bacterium]
MNNALFQTISGRAIVIGAAVKVAIAMAGPLVPAPALMTFADTLASVAIVLGGVYLAVRGVAFAKQRLLWRVRRKLIISYVFMGVVPAVLIAAFFLLGGMLLFSNISSYLVQNKIRSLTEHTASTAEILSAQIQRNGGSAVRALLDAHLGDEQQDFPAISIAVLPTSRVCDAEPGVRTGGRSSGAELPMFAGAWTHVPPPASVPDWIPCDGFAGLLAAAPAEETAASSPERLRLGLLGTPVIVIVRAVSFAFADGRNVAVVVDLPIDTHIAEQLRQDTGVALANVNMLPGAVQPLALRSGASTALLPQTSGELSMPSVAFLSMADWDTGRRAELRTASRMNVSEIYKRIGDSDSDRGQTFSQRMRLFFVFVGALFLVIEALALMAGLALARSITGTVHALFTGTARVRKGDFTHRIAIETPDQLGELAESFNLMTASIEDLLIEQAEKKRLEEELRIAHKIQMSLMPQGPLSVPGMSVTALCVPAREVGGDYYDVLPLGDDRIGVLIADVAGKGTSAALYMAELKGLILSLSRIHESPRALLIEANRIIAAHLDARSFITITYAVFD